MSEGVEIPSPLVRLCSILELHHFVIFEIDYEVTDDEDEDGEEGEYIYTCVTCATDAQFVIHEANRMRELVMSKLHLTDEDFNVVGFYEPETNSAFIQLYGVDDTDIPEEKPS